jgi:hypothetical protein
MIRGAMPGNFPTKQRYVGYREAMDGKVNSHCSFFNLVFKCRAMYVMVMQSPASHHGNPVGPVSERFVIGKITMGFGRVFLQVLQVFRQYWLTNAPYSSYSKLQLTAVVRAKPGDLQTK